MKSLTRSALSTILTLSSTFILTLTSISTLNAQDWDRYLPQDKLAYGTITLDDYREAFNRYAEQYNTDPYGYYTVDGKKQRVNGWMQFRRWEWEMERKVDPETGQFPETDAWTEWNKYLERYPEASRSAYGDWVEMGPYTTPGGYEGIGRLNCIAFHPLYSHTYWVGAPTGGIWKTTNYGASWTCYGDNIQIMGVSDIIIPDDYLTSNTIYIATGDRDTWDDRSIGVLKSTNGGITWQETDLSYDRWDDQYVNRLLKHPDDDNVIYAATTQGVYKTTDGGVNFSYLSSTKMIDMEFKPGSPDTIYGSSKKRFGGDVCALYRSTNSGSSWTNVLTLPEGKRAEIAVSPDEPDWIYALVSVPDGALDGVYRSTDCGDTWELRYDGAIQYQNLLSGACDSMGTDGQGLYDLCVAASPTDANMVFVGGINTWKSLDGGLSWQIVNYRKYDCGFSVPVVHADKHNLVFRPGTNDLYECHDGGLHLSQDFGNSWSNLSNGLVIGQIYRLSTAQTVAEDILTGSQDVGSKLLSGGVWDEVSGGDGMQNIIDPTDYQIQYSSTQNGGSIYRTTNHWASSANIRPNIPDEGGGAWVTPFVLDPNNPSVLFVGLNDLWKSTDRGDSFSRLYDCPDSLEGLRCIAIAPSNSQTMVIANKWEIYKTTNGGANWQDITSNFPVVLDRYRLSSQMAFKTEDDQTFWVTLGSYDEHGIYETTDGGQTFTNISDGLPHVPVNSVVQNNLVSSYCELYCGTEAGVFVKLGAQPWLPFNNNMPKVECGWLDIYYDGSNSKLRAGTWGRGVWESDLYSVEAGMPGLWSGIVSSDWGNVNNWNYRIIPDASTDVTIPAGRPNYPVVTGSTRYCNNLVIEDGASLGINGVLLNVYGNLDIYGTLELHGTSSSLYIADDITWYPGSSANIASNSNNIFIGGDWSFKSGTTVGLNAGTVIFQDAGNRFIECHSPDSYFHHLQVSKPSGNWVYLPFSNTESLRIMGNLTITANSLLKSLCEKAIIVSGVFVPTGNFNFDEGVFTYKGPNSTWTCNAESYFNGLNMFGPTGVVTLGSNITVNSHLFGYGGQLAAGSYTINLKGDWYLEENDFDPGTGKVVFCGNENQYIHDNIDFNVLKLDKPSDTLVLETYNVSCNQYIWNSGVLKMHSGSFIAGDIWDIDGISGEIHLYDGIIDLTNNNGFVHIIGDLYIEGGEFIVRGGLGDSFWPWSNSDGSLHMSGGTLDFKEVGILINGASSYTFTEDITGGTIRTSGSFQGTGNFFNPDGGTVELYGISDCYISLAQGSYFRDLIIDKGSYTAGPGRAATIKKHPGSQTTSRSAVDTSASAFTTRPPGGNRSLSALLSGNISARNISIASGELDLNGHTALAINNVIIAGTLTMNDPTDFLTVGGNVSWLTGSDANVTDGIIEFHQDWYFNSGTQAQFSGNNETRPVGTVAQGIYCHDDDACFDKMVVYNTTAPVTIPVSQTRAVRIADDLTQVAGSELIVDDSLIVSDIWMIQDGATVTLDNDATAIIDNQLYLRGSMSLLDGEVRIGALFLTDPTALLTINGGSFINEAPYAGNYNTFFGTTNLQSGILEITNNGLSIGTTYPFNMTGGRLRVGWSFKTSGPGVFTPSTGALEFIGDQNATLQCTAGNNLNSILILKTGSTLTLTDDLVINNDFTFNGGSFATAGYDLDIGDDVLIGSGVTTMDLSSSQVTVGGDWTNNKGLAGLNEGTSTVTFLGTGNSQIISSEAFYHLTIDKTGTTNDNVTVLAGKTVRVNGQLLINDGDLQLNSNVILNAMDDVNVYSAGILEQLPGSTNSQVNISGDLNVEDDASLILNNGNANIDQRYYHYGALEIHNSTMEVHGILALKPLSTFWMESGSCTIDASSPGNVLVEGHFRMDDGLFTVSERNLVFASTASEAITGGTLRLGGGLESVNTNLLTLDAGLVRFDGASGAMIELGPGNYLYDLEMDKPAGSLELLDNLVINNDVVLENGFLNTGGYNISVGGDWTNTIGPGSSDHTGSTLHLTGSQPTTINSGETFNCISIEKTTSPGEYVTFPSQNKLTLSEDLIISDGAIYLDTQDTLEVGGSIGIFTGAGLNAGSDTWGTVIYCGSNWEDFNSTYDENTGFHPGYSKVFFTESDDDQFVNHLGNNAVFHKLYIDNPGTGWFYPASNISVLSDCEILNGHWAFDEMNLTYRFLEDFRIESTGYWEDTTCTMRFEGTDSRWCMNFGPQPIRVNNFYVDMESTTSDSPGYLTLFGDVETRTLARILDGELALNGNTLTVENQFWIDANGMLTGLDGSTVSLHDGATLLVSGGKIQVIGVNFPVTFTSPDGFYTFSIVGGGELDAKNTIFENMDLDGVNFYNNGLVGDIWYLEGCTFRDGEPGGTLVTINNNQTMEIIGAMFPDTPAGGNSNVTKPNNAGSITFTDASGPFGGPLYEDDLFGRVHWSGVGEWTGLVSSDWHTGGNWRFDVVPNEYIHAYVPDSTPNDPTISVTNADCYALTLESEAVLTLTSSRNISVDSCSDIWGNLVLSANEIFSTGDIVWKPGSNATINSNSVLRVFKDMIIENGSNIEMLDGTVEFTGGLPSHLVCQQDSAALYNLKVNKTAGIPFYFDASSTGDLFILSDLYNHAGNKIYGDSPTKVYVGWGYYNYGGYLRSDNTHFIFNGDIAAYPFRMNMGDYFNDVTIESSSRIDLDDAFSDTLQIRGDLVINGVSGLSGIDANGIFMLVRGNWDNNVGTAAFIHGFNHVELAPNSPSAVVSGNNIFYELSENSSGPGYVCLNDDIEVQRSLNIKQRARLYGYATVANILDLSTPGCEFHTLPGSFMEANRLRQGGALFNSGVLIAIDLHDARLLGNYTISAGEVEIYQDALNTVDLAANITMTGGTMTVFGGSGISKWPAPATGSHPVITISNGTLDFADQGIHIEDNSTMTSITDNITGGVIRTPGHFYCRGNETGFSPTGGVIELYSIANSNCEMWGTGNAFWDLKINKSPDAVVKNTSSITIHNELIVRKGTFNTQGNPVYVGP